MRRARRSHPTSRAHEAAGERAAERGGALMLVPAGVLVLVILASIAVDAAVAFLGQRELANAAAAAANDAATAALSDAAFYRGGDGLVAGSLWVDPARAEAVARRAVHARAPKGVRVDDVDVTVAPGGDQVCVVVTGRTPALFAPALLGVPRERRVRGAAAATAVAGPDAGSPAVRPRAC